MSAQFILVRFTSNETSFILAPRLIVAHHNFGTLQHVMSRTPFHFLPVKDHLDGIFFLFSHNISPIFFQDMY